MTNQPITRELSPAEQALTSGVQPGSRPRIGADRPDRPRTMTAEEMRLSPNRHVPTGRDQDLPIAGTSPSDPHNVMVGPAGTLPSGGVSFVQPKPQQRPQPRQQPIKTVIMEQIEEQEEELEEEEEELEEELEESDDDGDTIRPKRRPKRGGGRVKPQPNKNIGKPLTKKERDPKVEKERIEREKKDLSKIKETFKKLLGGSNAKNIGGLLSAIGHGMQGSESPIIKHKIDQKAKDRDLERDVIKTDMEQAFKRGERLDEQDWKSGESRAEREARLTDSREQRALTERMQQASLRMQEIQRNLDRDWDKDKTTMSQNLSRELSKMGIDAQANQLAQMTNEQIRKIAWAAENYATAAAGTKALGGVSTLDELNKWAQTGINAYKAISN